MSTIGSGSALRQPLLPSSQSHSSSPVRSNTEDNKPSSVSSDKSYGDMISEISDMYQKRFPNDWTTKVNALQKGGYLSEKSIAQTYKKVKRNFT